MTPVWDKPAAKDKPLENVKPKRGMIVRLTDEPGLWQLLDPTPNKPNPRLPGGGFVLAQGWWCTPHDQASRQAEAHPIHGAYRAATYRDMEPHSGRA